MNLKDVVSYIEEDPFISVVLVEPGLANVKKEKDGQRIVGLNTENAEINEGLIQFDLLNIVLIGIANELPERDDKYELHRLLSTLLSMELSVDEKLKIMEKEYSIVVDNRIREDVSAMCNLSQGIREKATDNAIAGVIMNMYENNFTL